MASNEQNPNPNSIDSPKKRKPTNFPDNGIKDQQLKHAIFKIQQLNSNSNSKTLILGFDYFSILSDESLALILSKLPIYDLFSSSLVCKRWNLIIGGFIRSIVLIDLGFLISGRLICRFNNLIEINLVPACFRRNLSCGVLLSHRLNGVTQYGLSEVGSLSSRVVSISLDCDVGGDSLIGKDGVLGSDLIDKGLEVIANGCPNLRKIVVVNASEKGLGFLGEKCDMIQELELHCVEDMSLMGISRFKNLQILKLVGFVDGLYDSVVTDIGLTLLAQGCRRLVKVELCGCEGSYDGIKAIGQCCQMLEELTLCRHRMDGGWLAALSFCGNLKTLKLQGCVNIDLCPGPDEHLGSCPALEELYLERCQVRDKGSAKALFLVCEYVREISLQDCWGLDDDIFRYASICRRVKSLSLEGCSLVTIEGLDSVVHTWKDLEILKVVSCNSIKDSDITAELAMLFSVLKELKWRPDSRSLLASSLKGTGVGKKGGRFFKRA